LNAPLAGLTVIVTRPEPQARELSARLRAVGAGVVEFPTLAIKPLVLSAADRGRLAPDSHDWTIYTSANAVEHSLRQLPRPVRTRIAAIGNATARALRSRGLDVHAVPTHRADSEGLLELPAFANVQGLRVLVLRGVGGRDTLRTTLVERGAEVTIGEVYRRTAVTPTEHAVSGLRAAIEADAPTIVAVTSVEVFDALLSAIPQDLRHVLVRTPLLLPGDRVAAAARDRGWLGPLVVAQSAEDEAMFDAIRVWRASGVHGSA